MYNDLGDPENEIEYERPTLGGEMNPHPRRCRTGRPPSNKGETIFTRLYCAKLISNIILLETQENITEL